MNADTDHATDRATDVVVRFLTLLEERDVEAAVALLAEDIAWANTGLPTLRGKRRVAGALRDMIKHDLRFEVEIHHAAGTGDTVLTQRTDLLGYGPVATKFGVDGTFTVRDGLITVWADRYNPFGFVGGLVRGTFRR